MRTCASWAGGFLAVALTSPLALAGQIAILLSLPAPLVGAAASGYLPGSAGWPHRPSWFCSHSSACLACVSSTLTAACGN